MGVIGRQAGTPEAVPLYMLYGRSWFYRSLERGISPTAGMTQHTRNALVFFTVLVALAVILPATPASAVDKESVIRMARKRIGPEQKLKAVDTLKYTGRITDDLQDIEGSVVMMLKKPMMQRLEIEMPGVSEVTAVNGYEGWIQVRQAETGESSVRVMDFRNVERMLVNTWENLHFFEEPKRRFGKTRFLGKVEHRGRDVYKMLTAYPSGSTFTRYFDTETGELVATETDRGLEVVEIGMIEVDGLRFPRKLEAYQNGRKVHTIEFERIEINPGFEDGLFEYPEDS